MKVAFFADVHANLPAFEVVLADIDRQKPDLVFCLGDLVGYHIWPEETVSLIRKNQITTLMGNHEYSLQVLPLAHETNSAITQSLISSDTKEYLLALPEEILYTFEFEGKELNLWMVHGSPKAIDDYMTAKYPEQEVLHMMRDRNADILLCGHTHLSFHRQIQDGDTLRHVINVGSVGKPKDGDLRTGYVLADLQELISAEDAFSWSPKFHRLPYDVDRSVQALLNSEFPNQYADALSEGK